MSSNVSDSLADLQLDPHSTPEISSTSTGKPVIVGLYGIPGSGKSFLLRELTKELGQQHFAFFEGSEVIADIVPGGLDAFQEMHEEAQTYWRQRAVDTIGQKCAGKGRVAVVAGHFMFWPEKQEHGTPVYTKADMNTYTHILYLDVPAEDIAHRRLNDTERNRPSTSTNHLYRWQQEEKNQLRDLCRHHDILFSLVDSSPMLLSRVSKQLHDFRIHTEQYNLSQAEGRLDEVIKVGHGQLETVLVMDADRTLAPQDTGAEFWKLISKSTSSNNKEPSHEIEYTLRKLFSGPLGNSYTAFRQAVLLYEETASDQEFEALCQDVASAVTMHSDFVSLLHFVAEQTHVGAIVVTCGLRRVWEKVLEREGLSKSVTVIGGGRISDGFVVSATVKAALVTRLQDIHNTYVWAFGDSPLDLEMLGKADRAVVVVGEEKIRSKTMDAALVKAVDDGGLQAHQTMLPSNASPRLDTTRLPIIKLSKPNFIESLLGGRYTQGGLQSLCAIDRSAAKLLATHMRNAAIRGPALREAHRQVGLYLAIEFLVGVVGLEESPIRHVLGHQTTGYQLRHEQQTTIVALMRGGEPMAFGVNDAFPLAMFVHANNPDDIKLHHIDGQFTLILVDSVVNTGKTIVDSVRHVRKLHATIRIVVVVGVVQAQCLSEGSFSQAFARHARVHLIALRLSDTKFTGSGTNDTGNRLFGTTHIL
ncbi:hypothetical protein MMC09_005745 [Bachmanniomyces sp. S44760]|nr:hypothetical protein [Bachmanniomyces sp. S44760]